MEATQILNKVSFLEPLHGRRDKKSHGVYCSIQVFSPGSKPRKSSYLGLFVQKRCAWIHISEWGILYLITKIGFLLVKTQNQANFLVFEGFLGEKILHQYYTLT